METKQETTETVEKKEHLENETIENTDVKIEEKKEIKEKEETKEKKEEFRKDEFEVVKETNKKVIFIVISIIILLLLIGGVVAFMLINNNSTTIAKQVKINGIVVSGLNKEEAIKKLQDELPKIHCDQDITLTYKEQKYSINLEQIDIKYDIETAVNEAYGVGRNGNIFNNSLTVLKTMMNPVDVTVNIICDEARLNALLSEISNSLPDVLVEASYEIDDDKLIITRGTAGFAVNNEEVKKEILNCVTSNEISDIELPVVKQEPKDIDIEKIHNEIYSEAQDASYNEETKQLTPHVNGIDFAITISEIKELLKEEKDTYEVPLKITKPKVTTDKLGSVVFPDLLASFSTKYGESNVTRSSNIKLASKKVNGTILLPGETFSYNKVVGPRTAATGFKTAAVYSGGKVVPGIGGGICQVSSTIYNAALYANLEIVERRNHQFLPGYVTTGRDATVSYGSIDFKFKNTRKYPIKIVCTAQNGISRVEIYGIKEDVEYDIELSSTRTQTIPYTTIYENDATLAQGTEKVTQNGANGHKSVTYKIVKLDGKVISKTLISSDRYDAMNKFVSVGTGGASTPSTPVTPTTPEVPTTPETPVVPQEPVTPTPTPTPPVVNPDPNPVVPPAVDPAA